VEYKQIRGRRTQRHWWRYLLAAVILLLFFGRAIASYIIEYEWWREMGQIDTWINMLIYGTTPGIAASIVAFVIFWFAHRAGVKSAGINLKVRPLYSRLTTAALLLIGIAVGLATMDNWVAVRFFGGRGQMALPGVWIDPVFGEPLAFYLFELPFYTMLLHAAEVFVLIAAIVYWISDRFWTLRDKLPGLQGGALALDLSSFRWQDALNSRFLRAMAAVFLLFVSARYFLDRYDLLRNEHGFMTGVDYVDQNISLPLLWVMIGACLISAAAMLMGRFRWVLVLPAAFLLRAVVPPIVAGTYVKPSEVSIEKPFIERHIQATRSAFGLDHRTKEVPFDAKPEAKIDLAANKPLLDNVRLWDWRAFHAAVTQLQPLRPYVYSETDADRYTMDGQLRQVLVSPREIDVAALGEAARQWINPSFIYTHGYGMVMAEAKSIEPDGSPVLFIKDAPPVVTAPGLKLTRPEIYYGETVHEPVFVRTAQPEFNYSTAGKSVNTRYDGKGGFPISSLLLRGAAALTEGEWNILLTSYLTPESRMMIHRKVTDRLDMLAGFLLWDGDPYLVLSDEGHLVWMVDGYMTSAVHPYSRAIDIAGAGPVNYIRNSVKATVDAYDGTVHLYIFDDQDPLVRAYSNLFPKLFEPKSAMPADLRRHARYPETLFRVQAEVYRAFHVRDSETFYNHSDAWDIAKEYSQQGAEAQGVRPNYVVATLPGETQAEFLLMLPFTPRDRENLIGVMMARCDGEHLGEVQFLQLPRQVILSGPRQVEARINQDQNISKDLTLWGQQGSQVLHGQMLVLPIGNTFLYVEPLYIQAMQAQMPQLKKVVLAMGDRIIYTDTYDEGLAQLASLMGESAPVSTQVAVTAAASSSAPQATAMPTRDARIEEIRQHLDRYRELTSEGKWAEAGKELEAIQSIVGRR
jgi:uncharacterized membrane protein (UPF0182 family)